MTSVRAQNALRKVAVDWGAVGRHAAFGGGGTLAGVGVNALLGNKSLGSYLLSGGLGAAGGVGLDLLLNGLSKKKSGGLLPGGIADVAQNAVSNAGWGTGIGGAGGAVVGSVWAAAPGMAKRRKINAAVRAANARRESAAKANVEKARKEFGEKSEQFKEAKRVHDETLQKLKAEETELLNQGRLNTRKPVQPTRPTAPTLEQVPSLPNRQKINDMINWADHNRQKPQLNLQRVDMSLAPGARPKPDNKLIEGIERDLQQAKIRRTQAETDLDFVRSQNANRIYGKKQGEKLLTSYFSNPNKLLNLTPFDIAMAKEGIRPLELLAEPNVPSKSIEKQLARELGLAEKVYPKELREWTRRNAAWLKHIKNTRNANALIEAKFRQDMQNWMAEGQRLNNIVDKWYYDRLHERAGILERNNAATARYNGQMAEYRDRLDAWATEDAWRRSRHEANVLRHKQLIRNRSRQRSLVEPVAPTAPNLEEIGRWNRAKAKRLGGGRMNWRGALKGGAKIGGLSLLGAILGNIVDNGRARFIPTN